MLSKMKLSKLGIPYYGKKSNDSIVLSNDAIYSKLHVCMQLLYVYIYLPYACIYMDEVEQKFLETQSKKPLIWLRYIDDIFFIWTHGEQELERFLKDLNNFTPNLSFTHEASKNCIPFLDLKVKLIDGKLETDLYMKPADCHQYLHYLSSHPKHTKRSIIYSQTLRVNRLCSLEKDFNYHKLNMKEWFIKRGYPESVIEKEM